MFLFRVAKFFRDALHSSERKNKLLTGQAGDGREQAVLDYVTQNVSSGDTRGVIEAIDQFAWKQKFLMNIGDVKGRIIDEQVLKHKPKVVLELGAYVGYSAIRMASNFDCDECRLYSVEKSQANLSIATQMAQHAGLCDKITFLNGTLEVALPALKNLGVGKFDFVLVDHYAVHYLPDLQLLMSSNLLGENSVIVADNVLHPDASDYLNFVENSRVFTSEKIFTRFEYSWLMPDAISVSVYIGEGEDEDTTTAIVD